MVISVGYSSTEISASGHASEENCLESLSAPDFQVFRLLTFAIYQFEQSWAGFKAAIALSATSSSVPCCQSQSGSHFYRLLFEAFHRFGVNRIFALPEL